ncbi:MAG: hypothetical protein AB1489_40280 [Acidobacteriota bacterium]
MQPKHFSLISKSAIILMIVVAFLYIGIGSVSAGQTRPSKLQRHEFKNEPVRIIKESVGEGEEWLRSITIEVENISGRSIYFLQIDLVIEGLKEDPLALPLTYGGYKSQNSIVARSFWRKPVDGDVEPIPPNGRVQLQLSQAMYDSMVSIVQPTNPLPKINQVTIVIRHANYGDGSGWDSGLLYSPQPGGSEQQIEQPKVKSKIAPNFQVPGQCGSYDLGTGLYFCCLDEQCCEPQYTGPDGDLVLVKLRTVCGSGPPDNPFVCTVLSLFNCSRSHN